MTATDHVLNLFEEAFGSAHGARLLAVHAPARSEIAGNHTDHEGGHVIAGALDAAISGVAAANGCREIRVSSEGYPDFCVCVDDLAQHVDERVSPAALVRGMAQAMRETGRSPQGLDLVLASTIPNGGGLSSSAAMEAALGRAMEALWEGVALKPQTLARMGQRAENDYFGKPCGLMDQLAVCLGGLAFMDFEIANEPRSAKLDLDFERHGYALMLIDVGCDHSRFTQDYAAVPDEMQKVAANFGKKRLCEVDPADFDARAMRLREELGDRAVLRAIHYWRENELVDERWDALRRGDMDAFLDLTRESGASSAMFLQNVSSGDRYQPAMLALGLAERVLSGRGATRIHGGGFGGSIQAFVPLDLTDEFSRRMDAWLGAGSCRRYVIAAQGASATWL
ncbi:Galactokinase [Coriobacterium glomerans PW2]|uniref:Galactokinase n=1 Tax=Coriobacterium glomerans (strain ATCC 49209 / DSM 20642 / JCM 10262 / PW2) TaxID=700015 RepID=F2N9B0_CORGP|nr:galactokinase family protein [Coriobacterium glomerans]AEB07858.1 Galactokinase [Coriobacterium glomerans PW2]